MFKKITLKEFWESPQFLAINCKTKEQSIKLLKEFDKMGKQWSTGSSYLTTNVWPCYHENTCYDNRGGYADINFFETNNHQVLNFDDVIFEEEKEKEYIKVGNLLFKKEDFKYAMIKDKYTLMVKLNDGTELISYSGKQEEALKKLDYVYKKLGEI